ncbi:hypothetical protein GCM10010358_24880 [Streptomyces minutiscleroticus]|uniref:Uncharacterized protein n=1 Tax=Streptomyces minutiscleroticus TaxID=68238 RepID=A0A918NGT3_9ACTN|nr:hypothetical protein GCM10010358_24880 [Streptomyces minutiscleroticus]
MYDVMGGTVDDPAPETMRRVLDVLADADGEHPDAWQKGADISHRTLAKLVRQGPNHDGAPCGRFPAALELVRYSCTEPVERAGCEDHGANGKSVGQAQRCTWSASKAVREGW